MVVVGLCAKALMVRRWEVLSQDIKKVHVRLVNVPIQNIHTRSIEDDPITDISLIDGDVRIPPVHEEGLVGDSDVQF